MLPIRTILYPTDFSTHAEFAFGMACALARDYGARLIVTHIMMRPAPPYTEFGPIVPEPTVPIAELREKLEALKPTDSSVPVEYRLIEGDPSEEIVSFARENGVDLIVMGTHGRTGVGRLLMGSVAELVLRRAPCPVLTLKTPFPAAARTLEPVAAMAV